MTCGEKQEMHYHRYLNHLESTTVHSSEASGILLLGLKCFCLIISIIQYKNTVKYICGNSKYIYDIFFFFHSSESSGIAMSMMSLEEMKEAGMAGRGFKVLQTQGDLLWCEHVHTLQDFVVRWGGEHLMYFIEMLPCRGQEVMNYSRTEFLTNQTA